MVVFDEFQEIAGYKQEGFEKRLRAIIQQHENISYFFCGSQRHILTEIFINKNRAFHSHRWQGNVLCQCSAGR